jgi:3-phosphoshikimate 1-carboxyvinyltransferase
VKIGPAKRFWGEIRPPTDKSLTHRAYMISAIASGGGSISHPLRSEDCDATLSILRELGARVEDRGTEVAVRPSSLHSPEGPLDCGNSGTTARLMCGLLAGVGVDAVLTGDESLTRRPMNRVADPLRAMGAAIDGERLPLTVHPAPLRGIEYKSPVASAQVKSALLLAGLFAEGETTVSEPALSRDHTERMLSAAGCSISQSGLSVTVHHGAPESVSMRVPGDISSASFFLVAAALLGGPLTVREVGVNPTRTGILDCLRAAGVPIGESRRPLEQGEPVADLFIDPVPEVLKPFAVSGALVPRLIDEIPVLAVLATQCHGTSVFRDVRELRVKESDRIEAIAFGLGKMGAEVATFDDGMTITGPTKLRGATITARRDHRIAMAFAIAGLLAEGETEIAGAETVATSFPGFFDELRRLTHV